MSIARNLGKLKTLRGHIKTKNALKTPRKRKASKRKISRRKR